MRSDCLQVGMRLLLGTTEMLLKLTVVGLPWWYSYRLKIHLPIQGNGFEPWSRKIPRAVEQLSPCATTTEPAL